MWPRRQNGLHLCLIFSLVYIVLSRLFPSNSSPAAAAAARPGPDSDLSTSSLGFTGSLAHCQVQQGFNSGGDEIGSACCSGWSAPAKVVSVSCQLILCQSSSTSRSDRLPSHCPCPHLFISAPSLQPHVQFIYFLMPLPFASLLGLLCLLHHKVRSSAFEMLRKLAHRAPVDLFEENKRRLPPPKKKNSDQSWA